MAFAEPETALGTTIRPPAKEKGGDKKFIAIPRDN
jgi:hypothetical protein